MPKYTFICDEEDGGCSNGFILHCLMSEYSDKQPCPICKKRKPVRRCYEADTLSYIGDSSPKTVGALADHNTSKLSSDELHHINEKNTRYKKDDGSLPQLPDGMTRTRNTLSN